VLDDLKLSDATKAEHVKQAVIAQFRALRAWHDTYDDDLETLNKNAKANADALAQIDATRVELHNAYLAKLAEDLTPEQIEVVKDRMTYGTVQFTYKGYLGQYPNLTDEQKAKILEILKAGREIAMDGGSQNEKATTFKKYKGKINIYLGQEKKKAATAAASQPATQP
jgi:Spy/CpxP family protein refolding chaperone